MSAEKTSQPQPVVNDFSITVGTVNGSGSQTSNLTILRALFKMGIPVSGKNLFPSNIQGLPTWYTIRVSKDGYLARRAEHEIVVAMNPASFAQDLAECVPGGAFFMMTASACRLTAMIFRFIPCLSSKLRVIRVHLPTCGTMLPTWCM